MILAELLDLSLSAQLEWLWDHLFDVYFNIRLEFFLDWRLVVCCSFTWHTEWLDD